MKVCENRNATLKSCFLRMKKYDLKKSVNFPLAAILLVSMGSKF